MISVSNNLPIKISTYLTIFLYNNLPIVLYIRMPSLQRSPTTSVIINKRKQRQETMVVSRLVLAPRENIPTIVLVLSRVHFTLVLRTCWHNAIDMCVCVCVVFIEYASVVTIVPTIIAWQSNRVAIIISVCCVINLCGNEM